MEKCIVAVSLSTDGASTNSRFHKLFGTLLALNFGIPCLFIYGFGFYELLPQLTTSKDTICASSSTESLLSLPRVSS